MGSITNDRGRAENKKYTGIRIVAVCMRKNNIRQRTGGSI